MVGYDPNGTSLQNRVFMGSGPTAAQAVHAGRAPYRARRLARCGAASFRSFDHDYFTFRNDMKTAFETVQTRLINPVAKGPLRPYLERWFLWRADK